MQALTVVAADGVGLAGSLWLPSGDGPHPVAVVAHGAQAGTRTHFLHRHLRRLLVPAGIGVVAYDRRGEGESGGEPDAPYLLLASDLAAVVGEVRARPDVAGVGVWAFSQGCWIAAVAAAAPTDFAFLVLVSACGVGPRRQMEWAMRTNLTRLGYHDDDVAALVAARRRIAAHLSATGELGQAVAAADAARSLPGYEDAFLPHPSEIGIADRENLAFEPEPYMARLTAPALLFFGESDRWVPVDDSIERWTRALTLDHNPDWAIVRLPASGHAPTVEPLDPDTEEGPPSPLYERVMLAWLQGRGK